MIFDLHNDFPTAIPESKFDEYVNGIDGLVTAAIWTSDFNSERAFRIVSELTTSLVSGKSNQPVAIEDIGFLADKERYFEFDFSKYFYCTLTWNHNNGFAGGALDDGRLTEAGRRVISLMNGKCAVDLAHLNRRSFFDALDAASRPMCSHTGFNSHPRSLDAEQIRALTDRNSVIGLSAVVAFTGADTANKLANTIDDFAQCYGIDSLAIGTDFYGSKDLPVDFRGYDDICNITNRLKNLGYANHDIDKILYGNARRFYEEILNERHL